MMAYLDVVDEWSEYCGGPQEQAQRMEMLVLLDDQEGVTAADVHRAWWKSWYVIAEQSDEEELRAFFDTPDPRGKGSMRTVQYLQALVRHGLAVMVGEDRPRRYRATRDARVACCNFMDRIGRASRIENVDHEVRERALAQ